MECLENRTALLGPEDVGKCPNNVVCLLELTVVLAVTFLVLVGNVLSLIVLWSTPSLRNCHGYLIMSLAASDVKLGVVGIFSIYPAASFPKICWPHGNTACIVGAFLNTAAVFTSLFTLTLLSLERYIAVALPFQYSQIVTKKTTLITLFTGWVVIIAGSVVLLTGDVGHVYIPDMYVCTPDVSLVPAFAIVMTFSFAVPCVLIIVVTSCIVRFKLVKNSRRRDLMNATRTSTVGERSTRQESRSDKLVHMVRIMSITTVITWSPFFIVGTIRFVGEGRVTIPQPVLFGTQWVLFSNSFLNTLIYFAMNSTFRHAAQDLAKSLIPKACLKLSNMEGRIFKKCCGCFASRKRNVTENVNPTLSNASANNVASTSSVELQVVNTKAQQDEK